MGRNLGFLDEFNNNKKVATLTYIRRTDYRGIVNDQEFVEFLQTQFDNVQVAEFNKNTSFIEQFSTMYTTDLMLGIHGAAFTNMMFMRQNSVIIEMFPYLWHKKGKFNKKFFFWKF